MNRPGPSQLQNEISAPLAGVLVLALLVASVGCEGIAPRSKQAKRSHALMTRGRAVAAVEQERPGEKAKLEKAAGYAVIASATDMPYELPPGFGFGVVHDNSSGKNSFFLVVRHGADANVPVPTRVLVFDTQKALANFDQSARAAKADTPAALPRDADVQVFELLEAGGVEQGSAVDLRYWYDSDVGG
ncbi:MAG: hypothetical protein JRG96_01425 [Deltaproteobacteria bacterium]|nr:hypothetical protein [Deltaproteobacteria bacterium]MBW2418788.1 hypothetical protein [Deltaproteobacteria bacterium]